MSHQNECFVTVSTGESPERMQRINVESNARVKGQQHQNKHQGKKDLTIIRSPHMLPLLFLLLRAPWGK